MFRGAILPLISDVNKVNKMLDRFGKHNSKTISLRLPLPDYYRLVIAAKKDELSPGQFARDAVMEEIKYSEESSK